MAKQKVKRKAARPTLPMQRHLNLRHEGRYFDLREIFERVNAQHFRGRLRGYKVVWGRRRKERPKEYFIFGSIQEDDRVIRIHPLLDQPFVPRWFLEYVLYHEMLHSVVPDETDGAGRRRSLRAPPSGAFRDRECIRETSAARTVDRAAD